MKKVAFHNLGCKVNAYELDVMQQSLAQKGYTFVPFDSEADIYIVNTCTVTNIADRKSRQMLHRAKQKNKNAVVVAVGCYVQTGKEAVEKDPCIDLAVGNNKKKDLAKIIEEYLALRESDGQKEEGSADASETDFAPCVSALPSGPTVLDINKVFTYEEMQLTKTAEHTRAYIKIQDGCNQFCSYCAIPLARGRVRSRRLEDVLREVRTMVSAGYREVVLTGIHISSYGIDFEEEAWQQGISLQKKKAVNDKEQVDYSGESRLLDLIKAVHEIEGLQRLRLGSLEPRIVTADFADSLSKLPKVCPHFHLSLQSGCDETLKRMNRHYTTAQYKESVNCLRQAYEKPAITTDVIVGFPGETEEEFAQTKAFLDEIGLYEMHIFKYSKRANTRAAVMKHQVEESIKTVRSQEIFAIEHKHSKAFREKYLGKRARVLLEERKEIKGHAYWIGHTPDYVRVAILDEENPSATPETFAAQEDLCAAHLASNLLCTVKVLNFLDDETLLGSIL